MLSVIESKINPAGWPIRPVADKLHTDDKVSRLADTEGYLPSLTTAEVQIDVLTEHIVTRLLSRLNDRDQSSMATLLHAHIHWRNSTRAHS